MAREKKCAAPSVEELVMDISSILSNALTDATKFDKGNSSAGTRVRKAMQEIKAKAQEVRVAVSEAKAEAA